jgi:hypothetical protein
VTDGYFSAQLASYTTLANGLPVLNSLPNAPAAIYLDFDGHAAYDSAEYDTDGTPGVFSASEREEIAEAWRYAAISFAMFDINVTTIPPTVPMTWGIIGNEVYYGAAGVSDTRQTFPQTKPTWWVNSNSNFRHVIVHEAGHSFKLMHQSDFDLFGQRTKEYSRGFDLEHSPYMGDGYKWYLGHPSYSDIASPATVLQDDLSIISTSIGKVQVPPGDGYRSDDFGGTITTARPLTESGGKQSIYQHRSRSCVKHCTRTVVGTGAQD